MSDAPAAYPPPPPPNAPPPIFEGPAAMPSHPHQPPPPGYTGPTAPDYAEPYQKPPQPMEVAAPIGFLGGVGYLTYQFGGAAAFSILAGLASIAVPFIAGRFFIWLPVAGVISGGRAIQRGRAIGGIAGITGSTPRGVMSPLAPRLLWRLTPPRDPAGASG